MARDLLPAADRSEMTHASVLLNQPDLKNMEEKSLNASKYTFDVNKNGRKQSTV